MKYRWGALPDEQREGIKNYISNLIIKLSSEEATFRREKMFLNKLNLILVQVRNHVLHVFPGQCWPNVSSSCLRFKLKTFDCTKGDRCRCLGCSRAQL